MLISLKWLNKYVDIKDKSVSELENALTMIGQEVEKIECQGENLEKVLTAKIVEYEKHPDSDHLTICQVDNGSEILQVICGAPNHKKGDIVAMAQIGAKLDDNFVIKKGKIRGYESFGMLCSEEELKIGNNSDGIIILPKDTPLGLPLNEYLGLDDTIFELEITPNRPDCLSHVGIARELAAYYNKKLKLPEIKNREEETEKINIDIKNSTSNRYMARVIKNVKVKESPKWLKDALNSVGIRSINNLVDISNYVMLELNQPNHIFDYDKFTSNEIILDYADNKAEFITLDDVKRELSNEDIVVKNSNKIVALAGVMGGQETQVTSETKNILIEVAHFDNLKVRKTSRKLNIFSESSYRFERSIDFNNIPYVMARITDLIVELAGGIVCNINDNYLNENKQMETVLSFDKMNKFIGQIIEKQRVVEILENLEVKVIDKGDNLLLIAPHHRKDLVDQFDYFEEIIRMVGFDNIENKMPNVTLSKERLVDTTRFETDIKKIISNLGLNEVINYSFIPKDSIDNLYLDIANENIIEIKNPIIEDFKILRPTLMYSLIKNIKDNVNRNIKDIRIFELGKTYIKENYKGDKNLKDIYIDDMKVLEKKTLAIALNGYVEKNIYDNTETRYDFFDMKGILETFFEKIKLNKYQIYRSKDKSYHPGRSADIFIGKDLIATFGELSYDIRENYDIEKENIIFAQIYLDKLEKYISNKINYKPVSKYQSSLRDIAIILKEEVAIGDVIKSIENIDKLVEKVTLFDIYRGKGISENHKSVALSILLRDNEKTLEENEIVNVMNKIENKLIKTYGAEIR